MKVYLLLILSFVSVLYSCEKDEIPVAPRPPGDVEISQVNMGGNYSDQIYYRLQDASIVSQNLKSIWDLSFESSDEGWHILINSSTAAKITFIEGANFNDDVNISDVSWDYDVETGNLDSTAIGDWRGKNGVYVLDRGYDHLGTFLGNKKIIVIDVDENNFQIQSSDMDGNNSQTVQVEKNKALNFTQFSLDNGVISIEPDKDEWDILFTQYTHYFIEEILYYQVTGVLLNRNNVQAIMEDQLAFEDIDLEYAENSIFDDNINAIGYNWKHLPDVSEPYIVNSNKIYIIRDVEGIYYKLHFTKFYTDSGVKGAPKFEFQKL